MYGDDSKPNPIINMNELLKQEAYGNGNHSNNQMRVQNESLHFATQEHYPN